jgi:hypothetical protein
MNWIDGIGFLASAAVLATFCMKRMIALGIVALISNILFAGYGYLDHLYPVFTLHLILFPINCFRLHELLGKSSSSSFSMASSSFGRGQLAMVE